LDKLHLLHKHRRQQGVRIQGPRRRQIQPVQRSSRPRRDSKHPLPICHRDSSHHRRRQEYLARQDNLLQQVNPERLVQ
jgi:hypothetical protein